jgi:argininosuccinate lyase
VKKKSIHRTTVGAVDEEVLQYTAGEDARLDLALVEADCLATAAHVIMLSRLSVRPPLFTRRQCRQVQLELARIARLARRGEFQIRLEDQDVHLAIERTLTERLGDIGKNVHCARSRNDLVAADLRLYAREQLLDVMTEMAALAGAFLLLGEEHKDLPMVGRTHLQPAMPSSVGLWATSFAESLLDDSVSVRAAYEVVNRCPLGAAAGYGVPLPIDRKLVARLLGFAEAIHNVLYAVGSRGKMEVTVLSALSQIMLTLSRFAEDIVLFSMPEFGDVILPEEYCTGSSIMPQKRNPDLFELVRSRAALVLSFQHAAEEIVRAAPSGYNRDVQDTKPLLLQGLSIVRASLRVLLKVVPAIRFNAHALTRGFRADVFATDHALELVSRGVPFRDAYHQVKAGLSELKAEDPVAAIKKKTHWGAPAGLDFEWFRSRVAAAASFAETQRETLNARKRALLGKY